MLPCTIVYLKIHADNFSQSNFISLTGWPVCAGGGAQKAAQPKAPPVEERSSEAQSAASTSGRTGLWLALRCADVALVGERGSKVPSAQIGQLALEIELSLALDYEYSRCCAHHSLHTLYTCMQTNLLPNSQHGHVKKMVAVR